MQWDRAVDLALAGFVGSTGCIAEEPLPYAGQSITACRDVRTPEPPRTLVEAPDVAWTDVFDTSSLQAAVDDGAEYIRLADGVYTEQGLGGDCLRLKGQRLWAANSGRVRLRFGIQAGGIDDEPLRFAGTELHGLVFDIRDAGHAAIGAERTAAIMAWGDATDLVITDSVIHGNGLLTAGVLVGSADGFELARVEVTDTRDYGVFVAGPTPTAAAMISDLRITDVRNDDGAISGIGLRLSSAAEVHRVAVRDVRFAGIATLGESFGTLLSHIDIDRVGVGDPQHGGVGVYFDDTTRGTTLEHFCIGRETKIAVNSEWDHHTGSNAGYPVGIDNVVRHGLSEAWYIGVHFDQGTVRGEVHDVVFRNYRRAGIVFHHNVSDEALWPNYDDGSRQHDNAFEVPQVDFEVCDLSFTIWNHPGPVHCVDP